MLSFPFPIATFFTPISYVVNAPKSKKQSVLEYVDDYFFLGGRKVEVLPSTNIMVRLVKKTSSPLLTACKIVSYCTLVLPAILLTLKAALRFRNSVQKDEKISDGTIIIQKIFRKYTERKTTKAITQAAVESYKKQKSAIVTLQSGYRRHLVNQKLMRLKKEKVAATKIQKIARMHAAVKNYQKQQAAAIACQRVYRGYALRLLVRRMRQNQSPCVSLYTQLSVNKKTISDGYGEYLVYQRGENSIPCLVTEEHYNLVYEILRTSPLFGSNQSRSEHIREQLHTIDSSLDILFIPRTLYDLFYIEAAIDEEISDKAICKFQVRDFNEYKRMRNNEEVFLAKRERCWHICQYTDGSLSDDDDELLRILAFRMNSLALQKLPVIQSLTGKQITECIEQRIAFLKYHRATFHTTFYRDFRTFPNCTGGAINFGLPPSFGRVNCFPLGIKNENDAQIVRNATALECSERARCGNIIYRAEDHARRKLLELPNPREKSLSYGSSLFAGALSDPTACVFYYALENRRHTYATIVPNTDEKPPFYIPSSHPIRQLLSNGEFFHARTLLANDTPRDKRIDGICTSMDHIIHNIEIPGDLYSNLDANTLSAQLEDYNSQSIFLTSIAAL